MAPRLLKRHLPSAPAKAEAVSTETSHNDFDAREYFLALAPSYTDWPNGAVREFEEEGFIRVRLQQVKPHPVWELWMKYSGNILTSAQAGLGLAITKRLVELHGGVISADIREHGGAVFTIDLPEAEATTVRRRPPPPAVLPLINRRSGEN